MTSAIDVAPVKEGDIVFGRYRVERALGVGGMAVVVAAMHLQLQQRVAIKFLLPHVLLNAEAVERFAREARAAVRIRNEHVARVIDVGELESGIPYMVMEHLDGRDLADVVHQRRRLPPQEAVDYLLQACEAIAEAHSLGIVHRDLKPANLFLVESQAGGSIKVLDFGISKTLDSAGSGAGGMTQSSFMLGSPAYMSPEQVTSAKDVDSRTDIWSLGVILFEMLLGAQPFNGESLPSLCMAIMNARPASLAAQVPGLAPGLEAVVLRCLAKDRNLRFATVSALAAALEPFAPARARLSIERLAAMEARPVSSSFGPASSDPDIGSSTVALEGLPSARASQFDTGSEKGRRSSTAANASAAREWGHTMAERPRRFPAWAVPASLGVLLLVGGVMFWRHGANSADKEAGSSAPATSPVVAPIQVSGPSTPSRPAALLVARKVQANDAPDGGPLLARRPSERVFPEIRTNPLIPHPSARTQTPASRPPAPRPARPASNWEDDR